MMMMMMMMMIILPHSPTCTQECFDPVVTPEDRLYKANEQALKNGTSTATILDIDYREELRRSAVRGDAENVPLPMI